MSVKHVDNSYGIECERKYFLKYNLKLLLLANWVSCKKKRMQIKNEMK